MPSTAKSQCSTSATQHKKTRVKSLLVNMILTTSASMATSGAWVRVLHIHVYHMYIYDIHHTYIFECSCIYKSILFVSEWCRFGHGDHGHNQTSRRQPRQFPGCRRWSYCRASAEGSCLLSSLIVVRGRPLVFRNVDWRVTVMAFCA